MRQSTRIFEVVPGTGRSLFLRAFLPFLVITLCLLADPGGAVPVVAEAKVRAGAGDVHGAPRDAVRRALLGAVRLVVERHVTTPDLLTYGAEVNRAVLARPHRFVPRYSIAEERWDDLDVMVRVEAEVDGERVLSALRGAGVPVQMLAVKPRLLLTPLNPVAAAPLRVVASVLEANGYQTRLRVVPVAGLQEADTGAVTVDEVVVAQWARDAGCHMGLVLETPEGADAPPDETTLPALTPLDRWLDPGGEQARAVLRVTGWLVDAVEETTSARIEVLGHGIAAARGAAVADAGRRAGFDLGYEVLRVLEQSGWAPHGEHLVLTVHITGLTDPRLVEEVGAALASVPEVQRASLVEVFSRGARWRLEVVDSGLDWTAVLASARLQRGQLEWLPREEVLDAVPVAVDKVVRARWLGL